MGRPLSKRAARSAEFQLGANKFPMEFAVAPGGVSGPMPTVTARHPKTGETVGTLDWHPEHGVVGFVQVHPEYRGRGIATAMWNRSKEEAAARGLPHPRHSDSQSEQGRRWAEHTPE